jgi:hypothetical protein
MKGKRQRKPGAGRKRTRSGPSFTVNLGSDLHEALLAYQATLPFEPSLNSIVKQAVQEMIWKVAAEESKEK